MINITATAIDQLKIKLQDHKYVRLGVHGGACEGFSYVILFENDMSNKDTAFNINDIIIIIDNKSLKYLDGATLDYHKSLMFTGFKFINDKEKSKCSCGKSVSFKNQD